MKTSQPHVIVSAQLGLVSSAKEDTPASTKVVSGPPMEGVFQSRALFTIDGKGKGMQERVFKVFSQVMNVPLDEINEASSPDTIENWDSLKHMNLILSLEEEFDVQFTDEQIVEMLSLKLILDAINDVL